MKYNANVFIKNVNGYSSEMLLYKTLEYFAFSKNINQIIQKIYNKKTPNTKLIYGFKKENNTYRWEIYYYHYHYKTKQINRNNNKDIYNNSLSDFIINDLDNNNNIIINSVDILNNDQYFNNIVHTYEAKINNSLDKLPFYGMGFDIINNSKYKVGDFIYSSKNDIIHNVKQYFNELKLPYNNNVYNILIKYDCQDMCIWNKNENLFIQWFVISVDDFIDFLQEFNYKSEFINYIIENKEKYKNISHEITIVYNKNILQPIRSGFYGCL
jgi:hypothetical protein